MRVTEISEALGDAKDYLVNRLTRLVTVTSNGKSEQMRIVNQGDYFMASVHTQYLEGSEEITFMPTTYELEFWGANHGFVVGAEILMELTVESERLECGQRIASLLEGKVIAIAGNKVSISGRDTIGLLETPEC